MCIRPPHRSIANDGQNKTQLKIKFRLCQGQPFGRLFVILQPFESVVQMLSYRPYHCLTRLKTAAPVTSHTLFMHHHQAPYCVYIAQLIRTKFVNIFCVNCSKSNARLNNGCLVVMIVFHPINFRVHQVYKVKTPPAERLVISFQLI